LNIWGNFKILTSSRKNNKCPFLLELVNALMASLVQKELAFSLLLDKQTEGNTHPKTCYDASAYAALDFWVPVTI